MGVAEITSKTLESPSPGVGLATSAWSGFAMALFFSIFFNAFVLFCFIF
jgi:hypothetical protein